MSSGPLRLRLRSSDRSHRSSAGSAAPARSHVRSCSSLLQDSAKFSAPLRKLPAALSIEPENAPAIPNLLAEFLQCNKYLQALYSYSRISAHVEREAGESSREQAANQSRFGHAAHRH